jgi:RNA polymerase sigma factor (sigma-70 family)
MRHREASLNIGSHAALLGGWAAQYGRALQSFFRRRIRDGEEQDLVQEVFARLAHRGDLDQILDPERYIFRTASNVLIDWRRSQKGNLFRPIENEDEFADDAALPDRVAIGRDLVDQLVKIVGTMPERTQAIFSLYHFEHMSHAQIGNALGIAVRTVEDHMARANAILLGQDPR